MAPKVVLVTGSSEGGIGNAICLAFAQKGCKVYASARRLEALANLPASVERVVLDVLSAESCSSVVDEIIAKEGRLDILVNNAGAGATGALLDFPVDDAKAVFETNLFAPMRLTQLVVPHMAKNRSGTVINIGSIVGVIPTPWAGIYSTSKAALHAWTEVLRMEVKGLGVDVLLVAPGAITSKFGTKQLESFNMPESSLYKSVRPQIQARAEISQRSDHSIPASVLAEGIVTRALSPKPPAYYTAGGKALVFWILSFLPRSFVWRCLARMLGTDKVGK